MAKFCRFCGRKLRTGSERFCPGCGSDLLGGNNQASQDNGNGWGQPSDDQGIWGRQAASRQGYWRPPQGSSQGGQSRQPGTVQNNWTPQEQHGPVSDIFCYLLLIVMPLREIISMVATSSVFQAMTYDSIMDGSYMNVMYNGSYVIFSLLNYALLAAFIIFVVIDIVKINKQNYKILGLILFAIFLKPGYYVWRAHLLKRKMAFPIVYTVLYALLIMAEIGFVMMQAFSLVMNVM